MLFRKTFRNALATLIGAALALATGTAHAVVNLDGLGTAASPVGTVMISAETFTGVPSGSFTNARDSETYFRVYTQTQPLALQVRGTLGTRGAMGRQIYYRIDLGNMVWWSDLLTTAITIPDADGPGPLTAPSAPAQLETAGKRGDAHVIVSWPLNEAISADAIVQMALHNNMAIQAGATGTVSVSVYLSLENATDSVRALSTKSKAAVSVVQSVRSLVNPGVVTATVATGFTGLSATGANILGTLATSVGGGALGDHLSAQDGSVVDALGDAVAVGAPRGSMATFTGDFSVGNFFAATASPPACGNTPLATRNAQMMPLERVNRPLERGVTAFCVAPPRGNTNPFMVGEYQVAVDYVGLANAVAAPRDITATTIGRIRRDGTQVQIPYLTVNDAFRQRVVIVNRNMNPVGYEFSFTSEGEATTTAGEMAMGMVPGNSTMVLPTTDIVSIVGRGRTSATLDVVATAGSVDVATTQVNLDTYSTDTVVYDTEPN